jgi:hypothetical protein
MDIMDRLRSSTIAAALLFLTLVLVAAANGGGGGGDAAAVDEKQCHPLASEPYMLVAFHNKDGEEIRLLADQRNKQASGISAIANRSGNWFYSGVRDREGNRRRRRRRRLFPLPEPNSNSSNNNRSPGGRRTAESLWNNLGVLVNSTAASDDDERYMVVGMQTSGGDKIRLVVVADQRYFFVTGFAQGFFRPPNWSFRDGERHRLVTAVGNGGSHAEVVAANVLAAMMKEGSSCC